jgi:hypothetical protein
MPDIFIYNQHIKIYKNHFFMGIFFDETLNRLAGAVPVVLALAGALYGLYGGGNVIFIGFRGLARKT